jgi:predicted deacylase
MTKALASLLLALLGWLMLAGWFAPPRTAHAEHLRREFTIGLSSQGREIKAVQIGDGERKLVIVGDTHGGPEANTYDLTLQLIQHFHTHPQEVPSDVRLYLIPTLNPDGLALDSRFDAHLVDLNRNMDTTLDACPENDWRSTVYGAYGLVSDTGGPFPESQIESRTIRNFLLDASGAIFLHSNAGLVFPAFCEHEPSIQMAQVYAEAANYTYMRYWPNYMIHGSMADWASSMGIAAITPELLSATSSEFDQNLAGVRAVLEQPETLLPLPTERVENDIVVPAVIWRYWRSHGGEAVFGLPLEPAQTTPEGLSQTFSRARLVLRRELADTPLLVQPAPLGRARLAAEDGISYNIASTTSEQDSTKPFLPQPVSPYAPSVFFEQTGYGLIESFLRYWRSHGGVAVFGYPLSGEIEMRTADGQVRIVQYFERALFAYYPEDGSVRLEPLGQQRLLAEQIQQPWVMPQIR